MASPSQSVPPSNKEPLPSKPASLQPKNSDSASWFHRTFESLANPQYRLLWFGLLLTMGAMNMQMVARGFLSWELTHSARMVGLTGVGFAPPILLLSLFGGAVADRVEKKRLIQAGQLGMGVLSLVIAFSILSGTVTVWHLMAASVVQGTLFAFMMPARQSIIPQLVEKHQLSNAVALNASGMSLMTLAAPAIAGVIYAAGGPEAAYFTISGLNIGAVLLTSIMKPAGKAGAAKAKRMWKDMKEGIVYARSNRTVMTLLIIALSTTVLAMPFRQLLPVQIEEVFDRDVESFGLMLSMIGVGALVGSLLIAGLKTGQHRGMFLLGTTMMSGVAILLAGLNESYFIALAIMLLVGIGDSGRRSLNASLIMEQTEPDQRGRIMGIYMMNFGLIPLGTVPMAELGEWVGIQWAFILAGSLLIVAAVLAVVVTPRVRRL